MSNELRTSMQVQNNVSTYAVIQDLVEPYAKSQNKNNVSDYTNLDNDNEENNFVLLRGAKNRDEIVDKTRELTKDSLENHDKYERHLDRKYITDERKGALVLERFNFLKGKKQVKTFEEYEKFLESDPLEKKYITDKVDDERLKVFEEKSSKRKGSGATQELLLQIGTGSSSSDTMAYDPLTSEEHQQVAKDTIDFIDDEFGDNIKIISSVLHTKESIDHSQTLITSIDNKGRLNAKQAVFDAMQKYNSRHGLPLLKAKDYKGSFSAFVATIDDYQRNKCVEYGYNKKYDFDFADRGSVRMNRKAKSLQQMKKQQSKDLDIAIVHKQKVLSKLDDREDEVVKREQKSKDFEGELFLREMMLNKREQDREKAFKEKEQALLERKNKQERILLKRKSILDKREQDLNKAFNKISNTITDFKTDLLVGALPKVDANKLHVWSVKDEVPFNDGHKEKVMSFVFSRLQTYFDKAVDRAKPIMQAFTKHKDDSDYINDAVDELAQRMEKGSYSAYSTHKNTSKDNDLER